MTQLSPAQVAARVAAIIRTRPELWDQGTWWGGPAAAVRHDAASAYRVPVSALRAMLDAPAAECGTTCCVAGWAAVVAAPDDAVFDGGDVTMPDGGCKSIEDAGAVALGLPVPPPWDAPWLFAPDRTRDEVLAALDAIVALDAIAGRPRPEGA